MKDDKPLMDNRIEKLQELLEKDPNDTFALFAMAMEYIGKENHAVALEYLTKLLEVDPDYISAYYQKAQLHLKLAQKDLAKQTIEDGIPRAVDAGQLHARDKLKELLIADC